MEINLLIILQIHMTTLILTILIAMKSITIFDFSETGTNDWQIVNDSVMGGVSNGYLEKNDDGYGVFFGEISLDNNGGFASIRYRFDKININTYSKFVIRVKGDEKRYQLRVKSSINEAHSYIQYFETSGEWENVEIDFKDMYASFRGMRLNIANYPAETMAEISFLINNKKEEKFKLRIDKIWIE